MSINLTIPEPSKTTELKAKIMVAGVGGAGGNAINNMIRSQLHDVDFIAMNTDSQALKKSQAPHKLQLGKGTTQGLGAGAKPDLGKQAAQESEEEIAEQLQGCHMVFVAAGMGGGTGTGAAPIIAKMAKERGMLTVGVVTKPFTFEGPIRMKIAEQGIEELHQYVDTLIVIPNQNLFRLCNESTGFVEAFKMADDVLHMGVRGVTDLITRPSLVNLDFADIRSVMSGMGRAQLGTGEKVGDIKTEQGKKRAVEAAESAISNPLLEDSSMQGAKSVLVNITGGQDMGLLEVDEAVERISEEVGANANIIFGCCIDQGMKGAIRVSIVATGMEHQQEEEGDSPNIHNIDDFRKSAEMVPDQTSPTSQDPTASADSGIVSADKGEISSHPPTTDGLSLPFSDPDKNPDHNMEDNQTNTTTSNKKDPQQISSKISTIVGRIFSFLRPSDRKTQNTATDPEDVKTWPSIKGENPRKELEVSLMEENNPGNTDTIPEGPFKTDVPEESSTVQAAIQDMPAEPEIKKVAPLPPTMTVNLQTEEPIMKAAIQEMPAEQPEIKKADPAPATVNAHLAMKDSNAKPKVEEPLPSDKPEIKPQKADPIPASPVVAKKSRMKSKITNSQPMLELEGGADNTRNLSSDMDKDLMEIPAFLRRQAN